MRYTERYADYLHLGVEEWRKVYTEHEKLGQKAILFVMTDDTKNCDDVAEYLDATYPDLKGAVLTIHTKRNGEISESVSGKGRSWNGCASRPTRLTASRVPTGLLCRY